MGDRNNTTTAASVHHSEARCQPRTLSEFRTEEGRENRKRRLLSLWLHLVESGYHFDSVRRTKTVQGEVTKGEKLRESYAEELLAKVMGNSTPHGSKWKDVQWIEFRQYAEAKEVELWQIFKSLDVDDNGQLDRHELDSALRKAGIILPAQTLSDFMKYLGPDAHTSVTFSEFRDFLLLLPRKISPAEIYRYYQMNKYLGDDGKGVARVTMEGDVSLSAEDKPPPVTASTHADARAAGEPKHRTAHVEHDDNEDEEEQHDWLDGHTALKFLFAGGVAGAVSRTCTAPFDRLKIFLITRASDVATSLTTPPPVSSPSPIGGIRLIGGAVSRIYAEGGVLAFWTGNGLSVAKIFPESAIKFFAYESSKQTFAKYWDHVDDPRDISGFSRFVSGGIGGISSQLCIYPIETLKTQMMSSTGDQKRTLIAAARHVWQLGRFRAYYRGLTIGLVGVFPYSAIDMSTFEALKLAYLRSTGKDEPGVLALLAFGSLSGSVGATSVYPLNLVRTRLQASGSSGHPERYTGVLDVTHKTWQREGWKGFYRGLFPTLAKVVPAVSISYVVYEESKRRLGV